MEKNFNSDDSKLKFNQHKKSSLHEIVRSPQKITLPSENPFSNFIALVLKNCSIMGFVIFVIAYLLCMNCTYMNDIRKRQRLYTISKHFITDLKTFNDNTVLCSYFACGARRVYTKIFFFCAIVHHHHPIYNSVRTKWAKSKMKMNEKKHYKKMWEFYCISSTDIKCSLYFVYVCRMRIFHKKNKDLYSTQAL